MTRLGAILARAILIALLLLTVGGSVANADTANGVCPATRTLFPDDPGYGQ